MYVRIYSRSYTVHRSVDVSNYSQYANIALYFVFSAMYSTVSTVELYLGCTVCGHPAYCLDISITLERSQIRIIG